VDIHRERSRGANRVENIEVYASFDEQGLVSFDYTLEIALHTGEKTIVIRRAIANLPRRLRETLRSQLELQLNLIGSDRTPPPMKPNPIGN
jgi:hypothetical protein